MTKRRTILITFPFTIWAVAFSLIYHLILGPLTAGLSYDDQGLGFMMFILLPSLGWMFHVSHELVGELGMRGATLEWIGGFAIAGTADGAIALIRSKIRRRRERDG